MPSVSQGSNAGTSHDYTIFMENIPSTQVENWARIEAERFSWPVLRLFHTELETVYEEKNMSLTNDNRKVNEALMQTSFSQPSLWNTNYTGRIRTPEKPFHESIRESFSKILCSNNMAICMSGELDPDAAIELIDRYFGAMKPGNLSPLPLRRLETTCQNGDKGHHRARGGEHQDSLRV